MAITYSKEILLNIKKHTDKIKLSLECFLSVKKYKLLKNPSIITKRGFKGGRRRKLKNQLKGIRHPHEGHPGHRPKEGLPEERLKKGHWQQWPSENQLNLLQQRPKEGLPNRHYGSKRNPPEKRVSK